MTDHIETCRKQSVNIIAVIQDIYPVFINAYFRLKTFCLHILQF